VKSSEKEKQFFYEKYNVVLDIPQLDGAFYEQHLQNLDPSWTFEETKHLWELCCRFDLRFLVVFDQYDSHYLRTIENLKARFYGVCRAILHQNRQTSHPFYSYVYDAQYERIRKYELEKYLLREKENTEEERRLMDEIRKID